MALAPPSLLRPLLAATSELGAVNGLLYLTGRFLQRISRGHWRLIRYHIVAQQIPVEFEPTCRPSAGSQVRKVGPGDSLTGAFPRPPEVIAWRYREGAVCLAAEVKGQFAGFLWFVRDHYDEDEVHCRFILADAHCCVWDFDVHVEPQFRLGRTFSRLWDAANERLSGQGIRWSISRISAFNGNSLRSHGQFGLHRLETLTFVCLGRLQVGLLSCAPFIHLSWSGRPLPVVRLRAPQQ